MSEAGSAVCDAAREPPSFLSPAQATEFACFRTRFDLAAGRGGLAALLRKVKAGCRIPEACAATASLLRLLAERDASDVDMRSTGVDAAAEEEVVARVVAWTRTCVDERRFHSLGWTVLKMLTTKGQHFRRAVEAGAIELGSQALQHALSPLAEVCSPSAQYFRCVILSVLENILGYEDAELAAEAGLLEPLVACLSPDCLEADGDALASALIVLGVEVHHCCVRAGSAAKLGAPQRVVALLSQNLQNRRIRMAGCFALGNLMSSQGPLRRGVAERALRLWVCFLHAAYFPWRFLTLLACSRGSAQR